MLTKGDLRYVFYAFSFMSRWWSFPGKFNRSSGLFHIPNGNGRRQKGFRVVLAICLLHAMLMSGRTFEAGAISRNVPLEFLALGILASVASSCLGVMGILVYQTQQIQVKLWTELINRVKETGTRARKTWDELYICFMPFFVYPICLTWPVAYSVNPDLPFLLYGNIPTIFKCTPALVLCCFIEVVITTFYASLSIYLVVFIMSFVRQMKVELQNLKDKIMRFGIHSDSDNRSKNVQEPTIWFLEIEEVKSETRVTANTEEKSSLTAKLEVVCEVTKKSGDVGNEIKLERPSEVRMRPRNEIEGVQRPGERIKQEPKPKVARELRDLEEDEIGYYPETREAWSQIGGWIKNTGTRREFETNSETTMKKVKRWASNRATRLILRKAENWTSKNARTRARKAIKKWIAKRAGNRAVRKIEPRSINPESQWAENPEEKRTADRDIERIVNLEMEVMKAITETTDVGELKAACAELEVLRLLFRLFNLGFANIIFLLKVVALAVSIWGMFAAVRLAGSHPDFAAFYGLMAAVCVINYIGMFNNAFHLTDRADDCKSLILLQSTTLLNRKQQSVAEWNEIRCRIAAIPKLAIYSGHFHKLERDSTPIFINFVLNKLADLLLAF